MDIGFHCQFDGPIALTVDERENTGDSVQDAVASSTWSVGRLTI